MPYIIKGADTHPFDYFRGIELEFFPIRWEGDKDGKWVRNEEDKITRWGFEHPKGGRIILVNPAGIGEVPFLGQISVAFSVIEVAGPEDGEELPTIAALLAAGKSEPKEDPVVMEIHKYAYDEHKSLPPKKEK